MKNLNGQWKLYFCKDEQFLSVGFNGKEESLVSLRQIDATVPGCFEADFANAGILPDLETARKAMTASGLLTSIGAENLAVFLPISRAMITRRQIQAAVRSRHSNCVWHIWNNRSRFFPERVTSAPL